MNNWDEQEDEESDEIYGNGVNGTTGEYMFAPLSIDQLLKGAFNWDINSDHLDALKDQATRPDTYGVRDGVDAKKLEEAGWGVIFAQDADPRIREALSILLDHRKKQATRLDERRYQEYADSTGYKPEERNAITFQANRGAMPGLVDPDEMPYYLLIVGDPGTIPYSFQQQLDVQHAVGRIHFHTIDDYYHYAQSVVDAETNGLSLSRRGAFFGVQTQGDRATTLSAGELVRPLHEWAETNHPSWQWDAYIGPNEATKSALMRLLGGEQKPAFLFTASHGLLFDSGHTRQMIHQGAVLCPVEDGWPVRKPPHRDDFFSGEDLTSHSNLSGLLAFVFACFGAGTPQYDGFYGKIVATGGTRMMRAPRPFLANLPQQMLNRPAGGALAVIGHVDLAWDYTFFSRLARQRRSLKVFQDTLKRLLNGHPIGSALEPFGNWNSDLAVGLAHEIREHDAGAVVNRRLLAWLWAAQMDAQSWIIVGDPAVKLMV